MLNAERLGQLRSDPRYAEMVGRYDEMQVALQDLRNSNGISFLYPDWKRKPHPKQQAFYECDLPKAAIFGGQGSGKSIVGMATQVSIALGQHPTIKIPPPVDQWIVALKYDKVDQSLLPIVNRLIPKGAVKHWNDSSHVMEINAPDGKVNTIGFMSAESGADKFQSNRLDVVGFDEAPQKASGVAVYRECVSRFKPGRTLYIRMYATPWEMPRFFRDEFYVGAQLHPDQVFCVGVGLADNPYVPKHQVDYQARQYVGKEYDARILGKVVDLTGLVFDTISPQHHLVDDFDIPRSWPRYRAIDPTEGRRPWTIGWLTVSPERNLYWYDELEVAGTYEKIVDTVKAKTGHDRIQWTAIDPFASKHDMHTGNPWTTELARLGLPCVTVDRSKRSHYRTMFANLLGEPDAGKPARMFFFRNGCARMFECFMNHPWQDWGSGYEDRAQKEKEEDSLWKDFVDVGLYMIAKNPTYFDVELVQARRMYQNRETETSLDEVMPH